MINLMIDTSEETNGGRTAEEIIETIDFSDWNFYPTENEELKTALSNIIRSEIAEGFRNTLRSDPPEIEFRDGNISVKINVGSNWNDGNVYFAASLTEMVDDFIEFADLCDDANEAKLSLANRLRICAEKLEQAVG